MAVAHRFLTPDDQTADIMSHLGVEVERFTSPLALAKGATYAKIDACGLRFDTTYALLLSTDSIFVSPVPHDIALDGAIFSTASLAWEKKFPEQVIPQVQQLLNELTLLDGKRWWKGAQAPLWRDIKLAKSSTVLFQVGSDLPAQWHSMAANIAYSRAPEKAKNIADQLALSCLVASGGPNHRPVPKGWGLDVSASTNAILVQYQYLARALHNRKTLQLIIELFNEADELGFSLFEDLTKSDLKYIQKRII